MAGLCRGLGRNRRWRGGKRPGRRPKFHAPQPAQQLETTPAATLAPTAARGQPGAEAPQQEEHVPSGAPGDRREPGLQLLNRLVPADHACAQGVDCGLPYRQLLAEVVQGLVVRVALAGEGPHEVALAGSLVPEVA